MALPHTLGRELQWRILIRSSLLSHIPDSVFNTSIGRRRLESRCLADVMASRFLAAVVLITAVYCFKGQCLKTRTELYVGTTSCRNEEKWSAERMPFVYSSGYMDVVRRTNRGEGQNSSDGYAEVLDLS